MVNRRQLFGFISRLLFTENVTNCEIHKVNYKRGRILTHGWGGGVADGFGFQLPLQRPFSGGGSAGSGAGGAGSF